MVKSSERLGPTVGEFFERGALDKDPPKWDPPTALNRYFAAVLTAARELDERREVPLIRGPQWAEINSKNRAYHPWGTQECPEGIEKRASAHFKQMRKLTTSRVSFWGITLRTGWEILSSGILLVQWEQIWAKRRGYGFVPFFRYRTGRGDVAVYYAADEVPAESSRESDSDICWEPRLERYIALCSMSRTATTAVQFLIEATLSIQPATVGWMEDDFSRSVFSLGKPARETVLSAIHALREPDIFWTPGDATIVLTPGA
jgi:hypothetical protein